MEKLSNNWFDIKKVCKMKILLKNIINGCLAPINLKVSRARTNTVSGFNLFTDLQLLINTDSPVCLDVGANTDQTIDHLLKTFRNPYVYSFEPSANTFQRLKSKKYSDIRGKDRDTSHIS